MDESYPLLNNDADIDSDSDSYSDSDSDIKYEQYNILNNSEEKKNNSFQQPNESKFYNFLPSSCNGFGTCLRQISNNNYVKKRLFFCNYNCVIKNCPNEIICGTKVPEYILNNNQDRICSFCDEKWGKWKGGKGILDQKIIDECPVCYCENVLAISNPNCDHFLCIKCFKMCYATVIPGSSYDPEPRFPYPQYYDLYATDPYSDVWYDYPEILSWIQQWNQWEDRRTSQKNKLARCPLCRK